MSAKKIAAEEIDESAYTEVPGGVTASQGISACGISAGLRKRKGSLDMALVIADKQVPAAGVFTQNIFCAAPVTVSREHLEDGLARAIILNSAVANAATGEPGLKCARDCAKLVADELGCDPDDILVASTGVIGVQLDIEKFISGVPKAVAALSKNGGADAARAIMTTDTVSKECAVTYMDGGRKVTVGGMVKGSGMIMPNMATMLAVLTTDAKVEAPVLKSALSAAVAVSFNKVTVDSDTSTNDSCFLLATGSAGAVVEKGTQSYELFVGALKKVCICLARKIAADAEGSSVLVDVNVSGAASNEEADLVARAIANSPLVKTAVAGRDANWGRIAAAAGKCGAHFRQEDVRIDIAGITMCRNGLGEVFDEDAASKALEGPEVDINIDLGAGDCSTTVWTCDLTHGYIDINADYRS